jgi:hypothetical protein
MMLRLLAAMLLVHHQQQQQQQQQQQLLQVQGARLWWSLHNKPLSSNSTAITE